MNSKKPFQKSVSLNVLLGLCGFFCTLLSIFVMLAVEFYTVQSGEIVVSSVFDVADLQHTEVSQTLYLDKSQEPYRLLVQLGYQENQNGEIDYQWRRLNIKSLLFDVNLSNQSNEVLPAIGKTSRISNLSQVHYTIDLGQLNKGLEGNYLLKLTIAQNQNYINRFGKLKEVKLEVRSNTFGKEKIVLTAFAMVWVGIVMMVWAGFGRQIWHLFFKR